MPSPIDKKALNRGRLYWPGFVYPVKLSGPNGNPIPCSATDGEVTVIPEFPPIIYNIPTRHHNIDYNFVKKEDKETNETNLSSRYQKTSPLKSNKFNRDLNLKTKLQVYLVQTFYL